MLQGTNSFSTVQGANPLLTKVDITAWDFAQSCGSCHVGGGFIEKDRDGVRFSQRTFATGLSPYNMSMFERYDPMSGLPKHTVEPAPWIYPIWNGSTPMTAPGGWGTAQTMTMPDGSPMPIVAGQVMMPNVKEMDCLMCHFDGYNNMMSSVMAYSGAHNATPSFGAGFMNMFTEAYDFTTGILQKDGSNVVSLSSLGMSKMKYDPPTQNCRNCHMPSNLKDIPDMFRDFLSSAPMIYTGKFVKSFTGLAMPAFDMNAPMGMTWDMKVGPYPTSPVLYMTQTGIASTTPGFNTMIPAGWPSAMGMSEFNKVAFANFTSANHGMAPYFMGGGNTTPSGPIYYQATIGAGPYQDQNVLKKSTVPFPRAEWFKRGDMWVTGYDVHLGLDCSGCHMNTNTSKINSATFDGKSAGDPGRGFDSAGGVEGNPAMVNTVNSQNTVKSCVGCHVTGKNNDGRVIDTFGAPNPNSAHQQTGLLANLTKSVRLNATTGAEESFVGNHMDVIDCTVCHLERNQMVVRLLDCTSGNRYPNMLGFKKERGVMGMFSDPMSMGTPVGDNLEKWVPLYTWQKGGSDFKFKNMTTTHQNTGGVNTEWRRKMYAVNLITAQIWNNVSGTVDANGDGVPGRAPSVHTGVAAEVLSNSPSTNYDPWITRDMKAGMNFGPSGFAPIPIGFGSGAYQAAFDLTGAFTGAIKYVGVYGGNAMFSTPEEITAYKTYRTQISGMVEANDGGATAPAPVVNKSWAGTQLAFVAGPYKLTHGIRPVKTFVLGSDGNQGTSCTDCHSATPKVPMFAGTMNMLGTAINTVTAKAAGLGFMPQGPSPAHPMGLPAAPAENMVVVGLNADIETAAEVSTKGGGAVEVKFDEEGTWSGGVFTPGGAATHKRVTELDRSEVLYPTANGVNFVDVNGVDHLNRAAFVTYMNSITQANTGIGVKPFANFSTAASVDKDRQSPGVQVYTNAPLALIADVAKPGVVSYNWTLTERTGLLDNPATLTVDEAFLVTPLPSGITSTVTFTTPGVKIIELKAIDAEGNISRKTQEVEAIVPQANVITWTNNAGVNAGTLDLVNLPVANNKIKIMWGDGNYEYVTTNNAASVLAKAHTYSTPGSKFVQVYVYMSGVQKGYYRTNITVTP